MGVLQQDLAMTLHSTPTLGSDGIGRARSKAIEAARGACAQGSRSRSRPSLAPAAVRNDSRLARARSGRRIDRGKGLDARPRPARPSP